MCPGNAVCMANGQCVTPYDGGGDADCPDIIVDVAPVVPTVVLLIDQSGSMTENFGGVSRWNAVRTALTDDTNGVVMQLESQVIFGASLYTGTNNSCPRMTSVTPAINNGDEIKELLDDNNPLDNTPTAEAVAAAAAAFPASDGPRILVLATDGDPDTCEDPNSNGQAGPRTGSENAVAAAYAAGITTFVLSVGQDTEATHLLNLSRVGQGQDKLTGTATPYIANSPAALAQAFNDIIGDVRTCDFKLDGSVSSSDADQGVVSLDGTPLTYGTDWELNNGDEFKLLGESCNTYLTNEDADLSATFPCGLVVQ